MFLRRQGYSKRFTFDVIYSALQKSLRRGNVELAIEMGYEFREFPNALKKRLIQNCSEDCPDLYLINDIFNTEADLSQLMPFIPVICNHMKCHDGCYGIRLASEMKLIDEAPILGNNHDDLMTLLRKCFAYVSKNKQIEFISYFQKRYPTINLEKIFKYIGGHLTFLYMLCVWETTDYVHEKYKLEKFNFEEDKKFDMTLKLPEYIYDKHVRSCPKERKNYEFFINNLILFPRKEESYIEREGKKLYIETNKGVGQIVKEMRGEPERKKTKKVKSVKKEEEEVIEKINDEIKLIQTQLITGRHKVRVYYCSLDDGKNYNYILKGPFIKEDEMNCQLLSDVIKRKLLSSNDSYSSKKVCYENGVYILSKNLIEIDQNKVVLKSSKLEENVTVYDGNKYLYSHELVNSLDDNELIELLKILAFRKIIGTNDTCVRNIIYFNKHLFTIDDPVLLKTTPFMFKIHFEKYESIYNKIVDNNFKKITKFLNEWKTIINDDVDIPSNVKSFMLNQISTFSIRTNWKF